MQINPKNEEHLAYFIVVALLLSPLIGCSDVRQNRDQLNKFAAAYVEFHKALTSAEVTSWVIEMDQAESTTEQVTLFRANFVKTFGGNVTNHERVESARQALAAYDSKGKQIVDECETNNGIVDTKSLALIEAANAVEDEKYQKAAILVAGTARAIPESLETLRNDHSQIYSLQVGLLNAVVDNHGDLSRVVSLMKQGIPDEKKLSEEAAKLLDQEQASTRTMEGQYAAFKGLTGITVDYEYPPSSDETKQ